MDFVYSKSFVVNVRSLEISNLCPREISCLGIEIYNTNLPDNLKNQTSNDNRKNDFKSKRKINQLGKWEKDKERCPLPTKTIINLLPPNIKRITGILNKISENNYDKMIEETKTFNYAGPEVVTVIFKKILTEPFFSDVYAKFCNSLVDLHDIINERCIIEFKTKHKNLGKFIGELYKLGLLSDLNSFMDILLDDTNEVKLETLCKIITTIGIKNPIFKKIIEELIYIGSKFSPRHRFMILDISEQL